MAERSIIILLSLLFIACESVTEKAQKVVDRAIEAHGSHKLLGDTVRFKFRKHRFLHYRDESGNFHYERRTDPRIAYRYKDVLTNEGLRRYYNGSEPAQLSSEDSAAYAESVNSVIYFAFLPYRLNDEAVRKKHIGTERIGNKSYERVRVTFDPEGGGKDHDDVFLYWFDKESGYLDFFAYRYFREGGGVRFREAVNRREVDGLTVQDYYNFKAPRDVKLRELDEMWEKGELEKLSEIRMEKLRFE